MSIIKVVGVVVAGIPIVGILIGGITFGVTFKTDVANIKEDVAEQQVVNVSVEERLTNLISPLLIMIHFFGYKPITSMNV